MLIMNRRVQKLVSELRALKYHESDERSNTRRTTKSNRPGDWPGDCGGARLLLALAYLW